MHTQKCLLNPNVFYLQFLCLNFTNTCIAEQLFDGISFSFSHGRGGDQGVTECFSPEDPLPVPSLCGVGVCRGSQTAGHRMDDLQATGLRVLWRGRPRGQRRGDDLQEGR